MKPNTHEAVQGLCKPEILQPPELDHDKMMLREFDTSPSPTGRIERRVIWNLMEHLHNFSFVVHSVYDGGGRDSSAAPGGQTQGSNGADLQPRYVQPTIREGHHRQPPRRASSAG